MLTMLAVIMGSVIRMKLLVVLVLFVAAVCLVSAGVFAGVNNCSDSEFPCDDGKQCVFKNKWCDTIEDCVDESDEEYCHYSSYFSKDPNFCKDEKFICGNGPCIPFSGVCDGVISCTDGSDEQRCGNSSTKASMETRSVAEVTSLTSDSTLKTSTENSFTEVMNLTSVKVASLSTNLPIEEAFSQTTSSLDPSLPQSSSTWKTITTHPTTSYVMQFTPLKDHKPLKSAVIRYPTTQDQEIAKMKAEAFLIKEHRSFSKIDMARAVIALRLSNETFFLEDSPYSKEMSGHLQLKIATDLLRNGTKPISVSDLALYVNALLASCHNPHNFYGVDLVRILRTRTDAAMMSGEFVSPSVYLTLCLVGKGSYSDSGKLREILVTQNEQLRLDIQALTLLATACFSKAPVFSSLSTKLFLAPKLIVDRLSNETYSNVYTMALLSQALTVAGVAAKDWKRTEALDFLLSSQNPDGSFGDVLATYYVMPTLSGNYLESLKDGCYGNPEKRGSRWMESNTEEPKSLVDISLCFGNSVESVQSLQLKVKHDADFLGVLRKAEKSNPLFRLKYDLLTTVPSIYAIGDTPNDAERALFWNLYIAERKYPITKDYLAALTPFVEDIRTHTVKNGSHIIFWFRNIGANNVNKSNM